jgi:transcriptional regulator with XRE-family HTH domain
MKAKLFGNYFKGLRIKRRMTLRQFCEKFGFDAGNISKLERGLLPPPQSREKLEQYAQALGLKKGSTTWYDFFDLAAASRGQIPEEILANDKLVAKLPVLFRTLRGERVPEEKLDELIEAIRKG